MFTANSSKKVIVKLQKNQFLIIYPYIRTMKIIFIARKSLKLAFGTNTECFLNRDKNTKKYQKKAKKQLQRQNVQSQINSQFTPATIIKIGTYV